MLAKHTLESSIESLNHPITLGMVRCSIHNFVIPSSWQISCTTLAKRLIPQSDSSASGTPNMGNNSSTNSFAIWLAFWSGAGKTKGYFVRKSCITITYLFPLAHYVDAPYLEWYLHQYWVEWWSFLSPCSSSHSTFSTIPAKSNGINIHILPPPVITKCGV